jgi:arylsulfatase A-like enzyme
VDVLPTILDLVGIPVPPQAQGRSIVPLMTGAETGTDRVAITSLADDSQTSIVAADGWQLIVDRKRGSRRLYDLPHDPEQRIDQAKQYPDRVAALGRQLDAWVQANRQWVAGGARQRATGG